MFRPIIDEFVANASSISDTTPLLLSMISLCGAASAAELRKFLETECEKNEDGKSFNIPDNKYLPFKNLQKNMDLVAICTRQLPNSSLVNLVSQFDHYIGSLIRCMYLYKSVLNFVRKGVVLEFFLL